MASYKLTSDARADVFRIYQYGLRAFGEKQADKYFNDLYDQFEFIAGNPLRYPNVDGIPEDYRRCVYGVDCIYFQVIDGMVHIVRILGRQDHIFIFEN